MFTRFERRVARIAIEIPSDLAIKNSTCAFLKICADSPRKTIMYTYYIAFVRDLRCDTISGISVFRCTRLWMLRFYFSFRNIRVTITIGGIKFGIWQLDVIVMHKNGID